MTKTDKRFWIDTVGIGLDRDTRYIHFTENDKEEKDLLLNSGLQVYADRLNDRRVRFHKSDRRNVINFFKGHNIKVS